TIWEDLGAPIPNRGSALLGEIQLHLIQDKPTLVSPDKTGGSIHIDRFDAGTWTEVTGSPITVPNPSQGILMVQSASRNNVIHLMITNDTGLDPFHVRKWDGTTLTAETETNGAAGTHAG